jgi:predicted alpha/beta hydrolase family esterase
MAKVLIIHGWTNRRPAGHWQRSLAATLRDQGHLVSYPQLPNPDQPLLDEWLEVLAAELDQFDEVASRASEPLIVLAHSLGCVAWMQLADRGLLKQPADRVLLVAPPEPAPISPVPSFVMDLSDGRAERVVKGSAREVTLVGSDADVWQPSGIQAGVGDMIGLEAVVVHGAKHFSTLDGFTQWQGVIDWVNDPSADLTKI